MDIRIHSTPGELGRAAAALAEKLICNYSADRRVNIILATGASQFEVLNQLVRAEIPWDKVNMFHLDEYIGMDTNHPASFARYLTDRFLKKIDFKCNYYLIDGKADPDEECRRISDEITTYPIDVALIGIGENGHLAFNDPPADFEVETPFIKVDLDEDCRRQQYGEGWFESIEDVPTQAISMTIKHIMKSRNLIVSVPDDRKAEAVKNAVEGPLTNLCPASILRTHDNCYLFLDKESASRLK